MLTSPLNSADCPSFDVLVVGGGAAGLYAALCLADTLRVALITKDNLAVSASDWAQGGIAAAISSDDSPQLHVADTLQAGAGLCDPEAVSLLVHEAPACIEALLDLNVAFDRQDGNLALTLEAAHSRRRVLHAADTTGRAIVSQLAAAVLQRPNICVYEQTFVLDLWQDPATGRCCGVQMVCADHVQWLAASAVVLATGGGGQVYAKTTNPAASTGDGVAIAGRAGAQLRDLEFVQFHPTALMLPNAPHFLISEAVRGEGAHLIDQKGDRFAFTYHPQGELAPRDIVSRAIFTHLQHTAANPATASVWLDLRPIPLATLTHRFPNILHVCQTWGLDIRQQPIPVAPAAHYWMGGITTDLSSSTSIPGLYAVGETASTGVHGANRLASNSLLECLVFGRQLRLLQPLDPLPSPPIAPAAAIDIKPLIADLHTVEALRQQLAQTLWQGAGIVRNATELKAAIATVDQITQEFEQLEICRILNQFRQDNPGTVRLLHTTTQTAVEILRAGGELRNLLYTGRLILTCALSRPESRGGHFRDDYPQPDSAWQKHTIVQSEHITI